MAFIVNTDGTIQTDSLNDAIALSARLSGRTLALDEPIPFRPMAMQQDAYQDPDRLVPERTTAAKPHAVKLAAPNVEAGKRRLRGTGSVGPLGKNWRWKISTGGQKFGKGGFPTREAAEAALDAHLACSSAPALPPAATIAPPVVKPRGEWGDADAAGLQKHLVCKGRGCTDCKREGFRRT